jgi:hypothetical protein
MGNKGARFAVKWKGKIFKALRITRSKNCIVFAIPGTSMHSTYPADGETHWTFEKSKLKFDKDKQRMYFKGRPQIRDIKSPVSMGVCAGLITECNKLPSNYELLDLNEYQLPNMWTYLIPPEDRWVSAIKQKHGGIVRVVKLGEVWAVVEFGDPGNKKQNSNAR